MLGVPSQVGRDGLVLDSLVVERQHLLAKRAADHIDNTVDFERSLLAAVCATSLHELCSANFCDSLIGKVAELPGCTSVLVADAMAICHFEVHVGDVVLRGREAGGPRYTRARPLQGLRPQQPFAVWDGAPPDRLPAFRRQPQASAPPAGPIAP